VDARRGFANRLVVARGVEALENIRSRIGDFAGYDTETSRRIADEQVRAFVGERLAALPAVEIDALPAGERAVYDRVLLRAEFMNQIAFRAFEERPVNKRIAALLQADDELIAAANELARAEGDVLDGILQRLERAFDRRDAAMTGA
jgi:hypothetical protein